jgi:hypothetical protein
VSILLAALLLVLFQQSGVERITIAPANADAAQLSKAVTPRVTMRANVASATRAPWVDSNGWRYLRQPDEHFYCEAPGAAAAALAAAEGFAYGVHVAIHTDGAGLEPLTKMLAFLRNVKDGDWPPLVNIGFVDDGSAESGEFMNLLVRRNLLFRVVKQADPKLDLTVVPGSAQYPKAEAANPSLLAEKVRANLTDRKRLLRIYGSEVVVGRLVGSGSAARLYLINYGAARSPAHGVRIRVLGAFSKQRAAQFDSTETKLMDVTMDSRATEFTLPELKTFAIINLAK